MPITPKETPKTTQEMPQTIQQEAPKTIGKKPKTTEEIGSRIFDFFDKEKKGLLGPFEVQALFEETFRGHRVTPQDITKSIKYAIGDGNGTMTKKQYINFLRKVMEKEWYAD